MPAVADRDDGDHAGGLERGRPDAGDGAAQLDLSTARRPSAARRPTRRVVRALRDLTDRGIAVTFHPFIMMDVPADNDLPDPYGGTAQAAYPWRGSITLSLAPGEDGLARQDERCRRRGRRLRRHGGAGGFRRQRRHGDLFRAGRMVAPPHGPALCLSLPGGRRRRCLPDWVGAARPHHHPLGCEHLSLRRRAQEPGGRRQERARGGDQGLLCRRLERVFRPSPGGRLGRRLLPSRSAVGGRCDRLRRHRQLHAAVGLARRRRPSRCGALGFGPRRRLSPRQHRRRRVFRLVLCQRCRPRCAAAQRHQRRHLWQGLGVPAEGHCRLVEQSALRPAGWRRERNARPTGCRRASPSGSPRPAARRWTRGRTSPTSSPIRSRR